MIAIKTSDNRYFDLFPDTKIQWVRQNPFFREEVDFDSEVSLPFDLPYTINNSALLRFPEMLQTNTFLYQVNATVEFAGNEYFKGILTVLKGGRKGFTIAITHNIQQLDLDTLLSELPFESPFSGAVPDAADLNSTTGKVYPEVKFQFPEVINYNEEYVKQFAQIKSNLFHYFNLYEPATDTFQLNTIPVPMLFWEYLLDLIEAKLNLDKITGLWRLKCRTENYLLYNQVHIADANPVLKMKSYPDGFITLFRLGSTRGTRTNSNILYEIDRNDGFNVPIGTVIDIVIRIADVTGIVGTHTISHTVIAADILNDDLSLFQALEADILAASGSFISNGVQNNTYFSRSSMSIGWSTVGEYVKEDDCELTISFPSGQYNYHPIELSRHVPQISIRDAFSIVKDWFCLAFDYDVRRNQLIITQRKDLLISEQKDYTSKLNGELIANISKPIQYRITWENDNTDESYLLIGPNEIKSSADDSGMEVIEVGIPAGTVFTETEENSSGGGTGLMLSVNQPIGDYDDNEVSPVFRLVRYLGYINNSLGSGWAYPAASNTGLKPQESYNDNWADWLAFIQSSRKDFEGEFNLSYEDLANFDTRLRWRIESNVLIWREIRTVMTMTGLEPSVVKLKKI